MRTSLNGTGVWAVPLRYGDPVAAAEAAAQIESLGYSALWIPDVGGDLFAAVRNLLSATTDITVASGILNLWMHEASDTAAVHRELVEAHGDRFLVGIGVSHAPVIDPAEAGRYSKPLSRMREYLDRLDTAEPPLQPQDRMLAALGPRMLQLARERSAGAHPYLVTPEHTAQVRVAVGPERSVAPEQAVVLSTDPARARELAREHLASYIGLPNYVNNWIRLGFSEEDTAGGGSDRLVDALVAWGDEDAIRDRVQEHRDAGADHVCIQVVTAEGMTPPVAELRMLAPALIDRRPAPLR